MKTESSLTIVALLWLGSALLAFAQHQPDEVKEHVLAQAKVSARMTMLSLAQFTPLKPPAGKRRSALA